MYPIPFTPSLSLLLCPPSSLFSLFDMSYPFTFREYNYGFISLPYRQGLSNLNLQRFDVLEFAIINHSGGD